MHTRTRLSTCAHSTKSAILPLVTTLLIPKCVQVDNVAVTPRSWHDLLHVIAYCHVRGTPINTAPLFSKRLIRAYVPAAARQVSVWLFYVVESSL